MIPLALWGFDPAAWTAVGTIFAGIATGALVVVGVITFKPNEKLVKATTNQAAASDREATASADQAEASRKILEETIRDRELGLRPHIAFEDVKFGHPGSFKLVNIGRGPALACFYFAYVSVPNAPLSQDPAHYYYSCGLFALGAGQDLDSTADEREAGNFLMDAFGGLLKGTIYESEEVVLCIDELGKMYRFTRGHPIPDDFRPVDGEKPSRGPTGAPPWAKGWWWLPEP